MTRRTLVCLAVTASAMAAVGAPSAALCAVTIGSNLGRAPGGAPDSIGCTPPCTFAQATLAADRQAAGGIVSPVNGTVTLWRIRAAGASSPTALRVIRPLSGGLFTGAGTSATVTPALTATSTFPTQLPIAIGDTIGIDCCEPPAQYFLSSGGTLSQWQPPLADGASETALINPSDPHEIALNADIDPTSTFRIIKTKSKPGGTLKVTVDLPNPGSVAAGDKLAKLAAVARAKLLKTTTKQAASAGQLSLKVKATKAARSMLAATGKLKAKLKVVFTPTGGTPSTQVVKVKLKG